MREASDNACRIEIPARALAQLICGFYAFEDTPAGEPAGDGLLANGVRP